MKHPVTIASEYGTNDEGSSWARVTITHEDGSVTTDEFYSSFEEPTEPATVQAASFIAAFEDAQERRAEAERLGVHPLEIALAPYGPEWEREQMEAGL